MRFLLRRSLFGLGQDQQPAAEQQHFEVARHDAGIEFDDRVDCIEALAEITGDENLAEAEADQERSRCVFKAKRAVQSSHDDPFVECCWATCCSSAFRISQLLYKSTVT